MHQCIDAIDASTLQCTGPRALEAWVNVYVNVNVDDNVNVNVDLTLTLT